MTHLPLKLGEEYTLADGTTATIIRIGKGGKWAFGKGTKRWEVATGEHWEEYRYGQYRFPGFFITGRVEPAPGQTITIKAFSLADDETPPKAPRECWMHDGVKRVRMIEAAPIEAELARVTAERDEAVAGLRRWLADGWQEQHTTRAFLAKIGVKPAEARNSQSDISTAHDALLALEMLKERQTGDSSGGSWSRGWDAGLDAAIKVVANLTEAKP